MSEIVPNKETQKAIAAARTGALVTISGGARELIAELNSQGFIYEAPECSVTLERKIRIAEISARLNAEHCETFRRLAKS